MLLPLLRDPLLGSPGLLEQARGLIVAVLACEAKCSEAVLPASVEIATVLDEALDDVGVAVLRREHGRRGVLLIARIDVCSSVEEHLDRPHLCSIARVHEG